MYIKCRTAIWKYASLKAWELSALSCLSCHAQTRHSVKELLNLRHPASGPHTAEKKAVVFHLQLLLTRSQWQLGKLSKWNLMELTWKFLLHCWVIWLIGVQWCPRHYRSSKTGAEITAYTWFSRLLTTIQGLSIYFHQERKQMAELFITLIMCSRQEITKGYLLKTELSNNSTMLHWFIARCPLVSALPKNIC